MHPLEHGLKQAVPLAIHFNSPGLLDPRQILQLSLNDLQEFHPLVEVDQTARTTTVNPTGRVPPAAVQSQM